MVRGISNLNRKGQVTVFIIIGIIVLFTFAGILYFTSSTVKERFSAEGEPVISTVPQAFQPIQAYTESCLEQIGKRGLVILGEQGGYISPELVGSYSASNPTDSDGLNMEPLQIPYWNYNSEPNKADRIILSSLKPEIDSSEDPQMSVEAQLERFVKERLDACLDGYSPFVNQGFVFQEDEDKDVLDKDVSVRITETSVNFQLDMNLEVTRDGAEVSMDIFFARIPLELRHYFEVASRIADAEREFSFLERQGMELISVYSAKDSQKLPPTSAVGYQLFSVISWNEGTVEQNFKSLLTSYVPVLRFLGSERFYHPTYPEGNLLAQKVIDNMIIPLSGAEDLGVSFDYFGWNPYFKTNSENGQIKPEHIFVNYEVLNFGTQRYKTHYDASYPVLVTIRDENAFDGEGYDFVFALESNIRNNRPAVHESVRETYPRPITSLACRKEHWDTGLLRTVVIDSFSKEPIETVKIGFTIPDDTSCDIGLTDQRGELESNYPAVYGGIINFGKLGYLNGFYPIDTYQYKDQPALIGYAVAGAPEEKVIEMHRLKKINVNVKKKEFKKCATPLVCEYTSSSLPGMDGSGLSLIPYSEISCSKGGEQCFFDSSLFGGKPDISLEANGSLSKYNDYYFSNKAQDLTENEEVVINLERVSGFRDEIIGNEFFAPITVSGNEVVSVDLAPGIYKVSGFAIINQPVNIPAERRCFTYDIIGAFEKKECFNLDGSNLEEGYLNGNLVWELPENYFEITPEDLYTSEELTLYMPMQDILSVPEEIETSVKECGGYSCIPAVGCLFESCDTKTMLIAGRVVEDLQVSGEIQKLAQRKLRSSLEPKFS